MNLKLLAEELKHARRRLAEAEEERIPSDSIYILRCQSEEAWSDYSRALKRA